MSLNRGEIRQLAEIISLTAEHEIDCGEFLHRMAGYVEATMAGEPCKRRELLQHLSVCPECAEEVDELIRALGDEDD